MKKRTLLAETKTPDRQRLCLWEHDGQYTIWVGTAELMSTRQRTSEEKLAEIGCLHLKGRSKSTVLIGGLGLGFTLRSTLNQITRDSEVVVAELVPEIIDWNRNPEYKLASDCLADPRVSTIVGDVVKVILDSPGKFDSILLDVDNGPEALCNANNWRLYDRIGLGKIRDALRPGGAVAFWSAGGPVPEFEVLMTSCGFKAKSHGVRSHGTSGSHHTIFYGKLP